VCNTTHAFCYLYFRITHKLIAISSHIYLHLLLQWLITIDHKMSKMDVLNIKFPLTAIHQPYFIARKYQVSIFLYYWESTILWQDGRKLKSFLSYRQRKRKSADGTIVPERAKGNVSRGHRANVAKRDHGYYARTYVPLRHQGTGFSKKMDPRIREIPWAMGERQW
jgi:hypothetical protein